MNITHALIVGLTLVSLSISCNPYRKTTVDQMGTDVVIPVKAKREMLYLDHQLGEKTVEERQENAFRSLLTECQVNDFELAGKVNRARATAWTAVLLGAAASTAGPATAAADWTNAKAKVATTVGFSVVSAVSIAALANTSLSGRIESTNEDLRRIRLATATARAQWATADERGRTALLSEMANACSATPWVGPIRAVEPAPTSTPTPIPSLDPTPSLNPTQTPAS